MVSMRLTKPFFNYNPSQEIDDAAEKRLNGLPTAASNDMQDEEEEEMRTIEQQDSCITSLQLATVDSYRWRTKEETTMERVCFCWFSVGAN